MQGRHKRCRSEDTEASSRAEGAAGDCAGSTGGGWCAMESPVVCFEPLRIRISRVAAAAGYHPWSDAHETLLQHVYDGSTAGRCLRSFDQILLGLRLIDEDDALHELLALGKERVKEPAREPLRNLAREVASAIDGAAKQSASKAIAEAGDKAAALIARACTAGVLEPGAATNLLQRSVRQRVNTQYGLRSEDKALRLYERMTGFEVRNTNDAIFSWSFSRFPDAPFSTPTSMPVRQAWERESDWLQILGDVVVQGKDASSRGCLLRRESGPLGATCACDMWRALDRCRAAMAAERGQIECWLRLLCTLDARARPDDYWVAGAHGNYPMAFAAVPKCKTCTCVAEGQCRMAPCTCNDRSEPERGRWDVLAIFSDLRITTGRRLFYNLQQLCQAEALALRVDARNKAECRRKWISAAAAQSQAENRERASSTVQMVSEGVGNQPADRTHLMQREAADDKSQSSLVHVDPAATTCVDEAGKAASAAAHVHEFERGDLMSTLLPALHFERLDEASTNRLDPDAMASTASIEDHELHAMASHAPQVHTEMPQTWAPASTSRCSLADYWHGGDSWDLDGLRRDLRWARARARARTRKQSTREEMRTANEAVGLKAPLDSACNGIVQKLLCGVSRFHVSEPQHHAEDDQHIQGDAFGAGTNAKLLRGKHVADESTGAKEPDDTGFDATGPSSAELEQEPPLFYLIGAVDGIADEFIPVDSHGVQFDEWTIRPLIVEVKNRVRRVSTPPPFYDVVQAVTYCRMVGCDAADLVQALNDKIHISRIELDGPPMWHGAAWDNHVLPRLRAFATAVQKFRADTKLRASYLCGDERWRAKLLRDHGCGFLLHH